MIIIKPLLIIWAGVSYYQSNIRFFFNVHFYSFQGATAPPAFESCDNSSLGVRTPSQL